MGTRFVYTTTGAESPRADPSDPIPRRSASHIGGDGGGSFERARAVSCDRFPSANAEPSAKCLRLSSLWEVEGNPQCTESGTEPSAMSRARLTSATEVT